MSHSFIGEISIGRRADSLVPPSFGYANASIEENKKGVRKFSARFLAFSKKISTIQKIVFEAKAKDFKMCPRGQGRPRGHHLWLRIRLALHQENHAKVG